MHAAQPPVEELRRQIQVEESWTRQVRPAQRRRGDGQVPEDRLAHGSRRAPDGPREHQRQVGREVPMPGIPGGLDLEGWRRSGGGRKVAGRDGAVHGLGDERPQLVGEHAQSRMTPTREGS